MIDLGLLADAIHAKYVIGAVYVCHPDSDSFISVLPNGAGTTDFIMRAATAAAILLGHCSLSHFVQSLSGCAVLMTCAFAACGEGEGEPICSLIPHFVQMLHSGLHA
jgi:hypothetical protein